jgi:hypothetical protein
MESNKFADQRDWLKGNQKSFSGVHVPGIKDYPCSAPDKVASAKISAAGRKAFLIDHVKFTFTRLDSKTQLSSRVLMRGISKP